MRKSTCLFTFSLCHVISVLTSSDANHGPVKGIHNYINLSLIGANNART